MKKHAAIYVSLNICRIPAKTRAMYAEESRVRTTVFFASDSSGTAATAGTAEKGMEMRVL